MADIRKHMVIGVIAVLVASFIFSLVHAAYPSPTWSDYCAEVRAPMKLNDACELDPQIEEQRQQCYDDRGTPRETYDAQGCVTTITCDTCQQEYTAAQEEYSLIFFIITAIAGAIALIVGLFLPGKKSINEWIGSGLVLGGLISIFGGTIVSFGNLDSWLRPIILLVELVLVIYLAYRLWGKE